MPTALRQKTIFHLPTLLPAPKNGEGVTVVFSYLLPLRKLSLRIPLALTVEHHPKIAIVSNTDLELFGSGATESEAIEDFAVGLDEFYTALKDNRKKLSRHLKLKYDFLKSIASEK